MAFILDTDIYSLLLKNHDKVVAQVRAAHPAPIMVTRVTWFEQVRGRFEAILKADNVEGFRQAVRLLDKTLSELSKLEAVLELDDEFAANHFERMLREPKLRRKVGREDMLIACITLTFNATLVTRNLKDFALIPGLVVGRNLVNWAD